MIWLLLSFISLVSGLTLTLGAITGKSLILAIIALSAFYGTHFFGKRINNIKKNYSYTLVFNTASGEVSALTTQDEKFAQEINSALTAAIVNQGN